MHRVEWGSKCSLFLFQQQLGKVSINSHSNGCNHSSLGWELFSSLEFHYPSLVFSNIILFLLSEYWIVGFRTKAPSGSVWVVLLCTVFLSLFFFLLVSWVLWLITQFWFVLIRAVGFVCSNLVWALKTRR